MAKSSVGAQRQGAWGGAGKQSRPKRRWCRDTARCRWRGSHSRAARLRPPGGAHTRAPHPPRTHSRTRTHGSGKARRGSRGDETGTGGAHRRAGEDVVLSGAELLTEIRRVKAAQPQLGVAKVHAAIVAARGCVLSVARVQREMQVIGHLCAPARLRDRAALRKGPLRRPAVCPIRCLDGSSRQRAGVTRPACSPPA